MARGKAARVMGLRSRAEAIVPQKGLGGPMPWVIAILISLMVLAAAGGLSLRNLAASASADLSDAITVQIIEAGEDVRAAKAEAASEILRGLPGVRSVRVVPAEELAELLEPWLGPSAETGDIPIPAIIDVEVEGVADAARLEELRDALDASVPGARVDAQSRWLQPVYEALAALQWLSLVLIALIAAATAAAVWLAARNAFVNHRETVEVLHLLGGTDAQVTRIFQRTVRRDAIFGAALGLAIGLAIVLVLGQQFAALDSGMVGGSRLGVMDWLTIAAVPVGSVLLAIATGRITISLALRAML